MDNFGKFIVYIFCMMFLNLIVFVVEWFVGLELKFGIVYVDFESGSLKWILK